MTSHRIYGTRLLPRISRWKSRTVSRQTLPKDAYQPRLLRDQGHRHNACKNHHNNAQPCCVFYILPAPFSDTSSIDKTLPYQHSLIRSFRHYNHRHSQLLLTRSLLFSID